MGKSAFVLIVCVSILFSIGLLMVFNTTSAEVLEGANQSTNQAIFKQIIFGLFALGVSFFLWMYGYHNLVKNSSYLLLGCIFLLIIVFLPKIGHEINGAKRWVNFFGASFQPSELAKYIIPLFFINKMK